MVSNLLLISNLQEDIDIIENTIKSSPKSYQLLKAADIPEAIDMLQCESVHLIVISWDIIHTEGLKRVKHLKSRPALADIPAIFYSEGFYPEDIDSVFEARMIDYLRKPIDPQELLARCSSLLQFSKQMHQMKRQCDSCMQTQLFKLKLRNEKLENEVSEKKRDLTISIMRGIELSERTNDLIAQLQALILTADRSKLEKAGRILAELIEYNTSINWNELELRFDSLYSDFYQRLESRFPLLSHNDKRMCTFLRLNLSNKEIASLTFQNIDAIKKAKNRLSKKMNLDNASSLYQLIAGI